MARVEAHVAPRAWGLATTDPSCLALLAWMRFQGVPYSVLECRSRLASPNEELPFVALPTQRLVAGAATFSEVGKLATRTDGLEPLTELEQADADAYLALIQHALRTAWRYTLWHDTDNYSNVTRKVVSTTLPFPLDYVVPAEERHRIATDLQAGRPVLDRDAIFDRAGEAVAALAELIRDRPYCFGARPSLVDAWLYGYVAVILATPLPVDELCQLVRAYEPLVLFAQRVQRDYFGSPGAAEASHTR